MKIAVMAGTPIDSKLGAELLNSYGYDDVVLVPISNNPVEQTTFQALEDEERENIIVKIIDELKEKGCDAIFVYCNSLSSVVDFDRLAEKMNISIITPMQMYLGCTHFPYIKKELEKITNLHIIDVGVFMIESLKRKDI